ncbi:MAG: 2,3-bisphosphoglycerate-independent phosphoglycerate mutase [Clostridiales bacterium]|nr:2,3-bisphosphoglycerate-independent phosphoglycerate mutase [Clostridiales bacterium]
MQYKPVLLLIMDGWGVSPEGDKEYDATFVAPTPYIDALKTRYPYTTLIASGEDVGLPEGQMGNSEVGHLNIGAGRVVYQELTRINLAIRDGSFYQNPALNAACQKAKDENRPLHLIGLVSDGGVHSEMTHIYGILELAKRHRLSEVYIHALLDGRDTPPKSGLGYIEELEEKIKEIGVGRIASVAGRYYTMDRDKRWERVEKGYLALVSDQTGQAGQANNAFSAVEIVEKAYSKGETDEFVSPSVVLDAENTPLAIIHNGDPVIMFNFRTDRLRELSHVFTDEDFAYFTRVEGCRPYLVTMTEYEAGLPVSVAFPPEILANTLGHIVAEHGMSQLRIAETEKYAHVTFFFNGGEEAPESGEDRVLIPSPKVATYDLQPEMSAPIVGEAVVEAIRQEKYNLIVLNFANPDMVGHTGIMEAALKAVETVDAWVGKSIDAVLAAGGAVVLTADHGNAESMFDTGANEPMTAHTCNPVPCYLIGAGLEDKLLREDGRLADVAPTLLTLLGLPQPKEMTGKSLIIGS